MQHAMAHQSAQLVAVVAQAIGAPSVFRHARQSTSFLHAFVNSVHSSAPLATWTCARRVLPKMKPVMTRMRRKRLVEVVPAAAAIGLELARAIF